MSFCAASCCTCFPKASSAFATSAFSPTGGGPLSCPFAGKLSQWFSRKPNHKPPPPRKPDRFGSVPTVAGPWWSSRGLRRLRSSSVHHPFSPEPPHETTFPSSLTRCPSPPAAVVYPSCPPNQWSVPNLDPKSLSHHTQTLTQPILASLLPAPVAVPQASLLTPTRLNRHNRLPTGGSLQTAVSDAPRRTSRAHLHTHCRAHPIQHFYEKVIKVKADVAAFHNYFLRAAQTSGGDLGSCQGRPEGGVHLDP